MKVCKAVHIYSGNFSTCPVENIMVDTLSAARLYVPGYKTGEADGHDEDQQQDINENMDVLSVLHDNIGF